MKKYLFMLFVITFIVIPNKVLAEEEFVEVSKEVKYFKTVYYDDNSSSTYSTNSSSETKSYTIEVTEDEYYNHDTGISPHGTTVTTEYKKMVASILSSGSKYRYHVLLDWQQIPKTRSYDIIGIGHPTDVKLSGNLNFSQEYCISGGGADGLWGVCCVSFLAFIKSAIIAPMVKYLSSALFLVAFLIIASKLAETFGLNCLISGNSSFICFIATATEVFA